MGSLFSSHFGTSGDLIGGVYTIDEYHLYMVLLAIGFAVFFYGVFAAPRFFDWLERKQHD